MSAVVSGTDAQSRPTHQTADPSSSSSSSTRPPRHDASSPEVPEAASSSAAAAAAAAAAAPRSVSPPRLPVLTDEQLVEMRAAQRTFEGAYIRTALGQFGFALVVLRIFTAEFYGLGALFAAYGAGVGAVAVYRRHQGNGQFLLLETSGDGGGGAGRDAGGGSGGDGGDDASRGGGQSEDGGNRNRNGNVNAVARFRTSGDVVAGMTLLSLLAYIAMLVLVLRL